MNHRGKLISRSMCLALMFSLVLLDVTTGCRSQKGAITSDTNLLPAVLTPGEPHLLLLTGTISYDSLKATYQLDFTSEKYMDGYININDADSDSTGLHYVQLGKGKKVLSRQAIENPLLRDVEYLGETGYEHKVIVLPKADIFLRIQLDKAVERIEFRYGQQIIKRINIKD